MKKYGSFLALFFVLTSLVCCKTYSVEAVDNNIEEVAEIDSMQYYKVEMGRQLFYDPILSRDSTVSCGTCHKQDLAFTDGLPQSIGIRDRVGLRNAPTLTNVLNRPKLLLDGVNPSLEAQVLAPIQEHAEFDFHVLLVMERLKNSAKYRDLCQKAYGAELTQFFMVNSIAEFERTLVSSNSPYDQYINGNKSALTESQIRGKNLFFDKLYCGKCHNGVDLTNDALTNNGLYLHYEDAGHRRLTESPVDSAKFKVPTLRNVDVTAPYMHNGSIETLEDVIAHYMTGGQAHFNKSDIIQPFTLTEDEISDLVAFLKSLTDQSFLTNPAFADPNM